MRVISTVGLVGVLGAVVLTSFAAPDWRARAQPVNCEAALQFDTTTLDRNLAMRLSVLNTVDSSNYEQRKADLGASVPGYFTGNYNEFSEKRAQLRSVFEQNQSIDLNEKLYMRILSPTGARAFSECVARQADSPLAAWVSSSDIRGNRIGVTVLRRLAGTSTMTYTVEGETPINRPIPLTAGSSQTLYFNVQRSEPFFLILNASDPQSGATYSVPPLELPAYVEYRMDPVFQTYNASGKCGAGCQGNTAGCPLVEAVNFSAAPGYKLQPDTLTRTSRTVIGGPGLTNEPLWTWASAPSGSREPVSMTGTPSQCEGNSPHTQGIERFDWSVRGVKYNLTRVP